MLAAEQVEELTCLISVLGRAELLKQFADFPGRFPVDFTPSFLKTTPLEQLRHIFLALCLQCQKFPRLEKETAAA
jgi:hypothetical protein